MSNNAMQNYRYHVGEYIYFQRGLHNSHRRQLTGHLCEVARHNCNPELQTPTQRSSSRLAPSCPRLARIGSRELSFGLVTRKGLIRKHIVIVFTVVTRDRFLLTSPEQLLQFFFMITSESTGVSKGAIPTSSEAAVSVTVAGPQRQQQRATEIGFPQFGSMSVSPAAPQAGAQEPATAQLDHVPLLQQQQQQGVLVPVSVPQMLGFSGASIAPQMGLPQPGGAHARPSLPAHTGLRSPANAGYHGEPLPSPLSPTTRAALPQLPPDPTIFQLTDRQVKTPTVYALRRNTSRPGCL